jgi:hypothetical protein
MAEPTTEQWPNKYSLWLVPDEGSASKIGQLMQEEAAHYAGTYFPPHLTLLGHIGGDSQEQLAKAEQLAKDLRVRQGAACTAAMLQQASACTMPRQFRDATQLPNDLSRTCMLEGCNPWLFQACTSRNQHVFALCC